MARRQCGGHTSGGRFAFGFGRVEGIYHRPFDIEFNGGDGGFSREVRHDLVA